MFKPLECAAIFFKTWRSILVGQLGLQIVLWYQFETPCSNIKTKWKIFQMFVALSEYLSFTKQNTKWSNLKHAIVHIVFSTLFPDSAKYESTTFPKFLRVTLTNIKVWNRHQVDSVWIQNICTKSFLQKFPEKCCDLRKQAILDIDWGHNFSNLEALMWYNLVSIANFGIFLLYNVSSTVTPNDSRH